MTLNNLVLIGQNQELSFEQRLDALNRFEQEYKRLSFNQKEKFKILLYLVYRQKGALYYTTNINPEECNQYFQKCLDIALTGDYDSFINICITKSMLCKSLILSGFKNENIKDIEKSRNYFEEIKDTLTKNERADLQASADNLLKIFKGIEENNIWSKVNFEIPYYIDLVQDKEYCFLFNGLSCKIKLKHIPTVNKNGEGNAFLYNKNDKYGLLNHSRITVSINTFIEPGHKENVNRELQDTWKSISKAIEVWNYFIQIYRVVTKEYWLENINEFMILNYDMQVYIGGIELRNVPLAYSMGLSISNAVPCIEKEVEACLLEKLGNGAVNLWQTAYMDALKKLQVRNYKGAIIQINIALENYLYIYAKTLLIPCLGESATMDFLNGKIEYNNFYLNNYISKEIFEQMVIDGAIKANPPTTYAIIKKCAEFWGVGISKRRVNSKISIIRENRNDIVHGIDINENLKSVSEKAIDAFEELIEILKNTSNKLREKM